MRSILPRCVALGLALSSALVPAAAFAQACCAGSTTFTPARLALAEDWLVAYQAKGSAAFGAFDAHGTYAAAPPATAEVDLEQDLIGAVRVLRHGQLSALLPFVETYRAAVPLREAGGGFGDLNVSARWDFLSAGRSAVVPGVAALGGVTFPTGRPPEQTTSPLATGATGVGTVQGNLGVAVEQTWGPWLVNVTGIVAGRLPRNVRGVSSALGTRVTGLLGAAYVFDSEVSVGVVLSYAWEDEARESGVSIDGTTRRLLTAAASLSWPLGNGCRLQSSLSLTPPLSGLGQNELASVGASATLVIARWFPVGG